MALFLLKKCDSMRYFLNVLWDYKIEDTYEEKMLSLDMKRKNVLTLKARIHIAVFYVPKTIRWKKHVLFCPSTIVNLFFVDLSTRTR